MATRSTGHGIRHTGTRGHRDSGLAPPAARGQVQYHHWRAVGSSTISGARLGPAPPAAHGQGQYHQRYAEPGPSPPGQAAWASTARRTQPWPGVRSLGLHRRGRAACSDGHTEPRPATPGHAAWQAQPGTRSRGLHRRGLVDHQMYAAGPAPSELHGRASTTSGAWPATSGARPGQHHHQRYAVGQLHHPAPKPPCPAPKPSRPAPKSFWPAPRPS
jgi:hypothetical protein